MKRIILLIAVFGFINISAGVIAPVNNGPVATEEAIRLLADRSVLAMHPEFRELNGNLFLAIKTSQPLAVEDGDVVEFVFDRKTRLISFHINDINQTLIDKGEATLFVMIHQDLALELRQKKLKKVNVISNGNTYTLEVNDKWVPDHYLASK